MKNNWSNKYILNLDYENKKTVYIYIGDVFKLALLQTYFII